MRKILHTVSEKEAVFFWGIVVLLFLATYKYVAYPEPYMFQTAAPTEKIEIGDDIITQDIIIDPASKWGGCSLYFSVDTPASDGYIEVLLKENGNTLGKCAIQTFDIADGYYELKDFDYSKLSPGFAQIKVRGVGLKQPVYLGVVPNIYNIPNYYVNGKEAESTLAQQYHYYFVKREYRLGTILFLILIVINLGTMAVAFRKETARTSLVVRTGLMLSYICLTYIYDSTLFLSPTWAEGITNYMHHAMKSGFVQNFLTPDAGYLPLFQRCVALFLIKILKVSPYYAVYIMQLLAYVLTGYVLSFFCKTQYTRYFSLKYRYILCLTLIMQVIDKETGAFINFMTYGVVLIFLYFLADSEKWSKGEYVLLCLWGCVACLSKGAYVTMLPFMLLCLIIFYKSYKRRDKIFMLSCALGASVQLVYYLYQIYYFAQGTEWLVVNSNNSAKTNYISKLIGSIFIDTPNHLLYLLGVNATFFNGISFLIIVAFWIGLFYLFIKKVLIDYIRKKDIDFDVRNLFMLLIYIIAQCLFLRITLYGVSESDIVDDNFWLFQDRGIASRHQIYIWMATICIFVIGIKLLYKKGVKQIWNKAFIIFILCLMIADPRFQIKGFGDDSYAASRPYIRDINAEYTLLKGIEHIKCRAVPIQPNGWCYLKNAALYHIGTNIFNWKSTPINEHVSVLSGKVSLKKFPSINSKVKIWQIFVARPALVNNKVWQVVLKDRQGKEILRMNQDNTNYQKIVSFTFDEGIHHIGTVEILDSDGNRVNIQNGMYFVTWETSEFIKNTHMGGAVT